MADLHLGIVETGAHAERLEELALLLRQDLLELEVDRVDPAPLTDIPPGARSTAAALAGALVVYLKPTVEALGALVAAVRDWLGRGGGGERNRSVRMEINGDILEVTGVSTDLQSRLVNEWIQRHAAT